MLLRQIGAIVIAIALSNSSFGLNFIGNYEILIFIGISFTLFITTGISESFNLLFNYDIQRLPFSVFWGSTIICFSIYGILIGLEKPIVQLLTSSSEIEYFHLYCLHILIEFNSWLTPIYLFRLKEKGLLIYYGVVSNLAWIVIVILPAILNWNPQLIFYGLIILSVLKQIFLIVILLRFAVLQIDLKLLKDWIVKAMPLMGYAFLGGIHLITDNWMVGYFYPSDKEQFAIFRYGARELPFSIIITATFGAAIIPLLSENRYDGLIAMKTKIKKLIHAFFLISIFMMLVSKKMFLEIFGADFEISADIFGVYLLVIISRLLVLKPVVMVNDLSNWLVPIAIAELIINTAVSFYLVPVMGLIGIAWGTVIAYSFEKIVMMALLKFKKQINPSSIIPIKLFLSYTSLLIIVYLSTFVI